MSSSLSASPSFPTVALAHSMNSSGRFGLYVDPTSCSCGTCTEYCAERAEAMPFGPQATEPALSSTTLEDMYRQMRSPAPAPAPAVLSTPPPPLIRASLGLPPPVYRVGALGRAPANHLWTGSDWVHQDSPYARSPAVARTLFPEPSPPEPAPSILSPPAPSPTEESVMDSLRYLRADLQLKQREIYAGEARSHDEMAMQNAEWSELEDKIHAIENLLLAFGSFFRTG